MLTFFANVAHKPCCFSKACILIFHRLKLFLPVNLSIFILIPDIFLTQIEKPKLLIPICYNGCEKEQIMNVENNKEHTDLTWFTNRVLATSTDRERYVLLLVRNTRITDVINELINIITNQVKSLIITRLKIVKPASKLHSPSQSGQNLPVGRASKTDEQATNIWPGHPGQAVRLTERAPNLLIFESHFTRLKALDFKVIF